MSDIAFYMTAHGYGHGVRSCDLLNTFHRLDPDVSIRIISTLPEWFVRGRLAFEPMEFRAASFDVGMVQKDSVQVDLDMTAVNLQALCASWSTQVTEEAKWIKEQGVQLVVVDIPGIPIEAAAAVRVPSLALGNFHWAWIYEEFVGQHPIWQEAVERFNQAYALCGGLLRYPFSGPMEPFPNIQDVPLVAAQGEDHRIALARTLGADPQKRWALLSFTTLDVRQDALRNMSAAGDTEFFTLQPLGWDLPGFHKIDTAQFQVRDVFASVDVVITKPGFGVLSDCAVNQKPIIYVERSNWREYDVLEEALKKHFKSVHLPAEKLYSGNIQEALEAVAEAAEPQEPCQADGGVRAAELVEQAIGY